MSDSFISASYAAPTDITDAYRDLESDLGKLVTTTFRRRLVKTGQRILRIVKVKPGPVVYANNGKLRWKSRKQQQAFFASNGFGGGIPTERTDAYINDFEVVVETTDFAGSVSVINNNPAAGYIGGDDQQPFHEDTGWPNITKTLEAEEPNVEDDLINDYFLLADPEALTR